MLDFKFENLHIISYFIGYEKKVNIVDKYDRRSLYLMFLKCYLYLHPMAEFEVGCANQITNASSGLYILKQNPSTNELATKLVTKQIFIFKCFQVDLKEIKCSLQWWGKQEAMFYQILGL
jgi:hypothetical protein